MQRGGWAWLRFGGGGQSLGVQLVNWMVVEDARTAYGYTDVVVKESPPSAREIWLMDQTNEWLGIIQDPVVRLVIARRMLYDDTRGRCIFSYRKIGKLVKTSSERVRRMYWRGLEDIADALNKNNRVKDKLILYLPEVEGPNSVSMDFGRSASEESLV